MSIQDIHRQGLAIKASAEAMLNFTKQDVFVDDSILETLRVLVEATKKEKPNDSVILSLNVGQKDVRWSEVLAIASIISTA